MKNFVCVLCYYFIFILLHVCFFAKTRCPVRQSLLFAGATRRSWYRGQPVKVHKFHTDVELYTVLPQTGQGTARFSIAKLEIIFGNCNSSILKNHSQAPQICYTTCFHATFNKCFRCMMMPDKYKKARRRSASGLYHLPRIRDSAGWLCEPEGECSFPWCSFYSSHAGECLPLDGLEQCSAAGGNIAHLTGQSEFIDTGHGIAATHQGECAVAGSFGYCFCNGT